MPSSSVARSTPAPLRTGDGLLVYVESARLVVMSNELFLFGSPTLATSPDGVPFTYQDGGASRAVLAGVSLDKRLVASPIRLPSGATLLSEPRAVATPVHTVDLLWRTDNSRSGGRARDARLAALRVSRARRRVGERG